MEVAEVLRQSYRLNSRVALRYAHGWSQRQAADEWNKRWPDELKTFKMFSYWEMWPSSTGHAPTFDNLSKLAELYECAVSDLLTDLPDFRHRDTAAGLQETALTVCKPDAELVVPSDVAVWRRRPVFSCRTTLSHCSCSISDHWHRLIARRAQRPVTVTGRTISLFSSSAVGRTPWTVATRCVS